jgi:hypothetical protein
VGIQRRGVPRQQLIEVSQQKAGGFSCPGEVALVAGLNDFGNFAADDGERVTLDQDAGEPTRSQAHHNVVPTVREQLCLNALHRTIQRDITS